jgi:hypothetical protein
MTKLFLGKSEEKAGGKVKIFSKEWYNNASGRDTAISSRRS